MNLLTWHGTVLCIDTARSVLVHTNILPALPGLTALSIDLPPAMAAPRHIRDMPSVTLEPGNRPGLIHIRRDGIYLSIVPGQPEAIFNASHPGPWETLLAIAPNGLADLRALLSERWGSRDARGDLVETTWRLEEGFLLDDGIVRLDLVAHAPPVPAADGITRVRLSGGARQEVMLRPLAAHFQPAEAAGPADFTARTSRQMTLAGDGEVIALPLTICDADRDWLHDKPYRGHDPQLGRHVCKPVAVHDADKFVLLARHIEGMIFDADGVSSDMGYLSNLGTGGRRHLPMPGFMRGEGERIFVSRDAMAQAPALSGAYAVFYNGNLSNYTHWLIEALLPLHVLLPHLPPGTKLLLPGTLRGFRNARTPICDHHDTLRAFGFADLPAVEIMQGLCQVEEVYWLAHGTIENMPATAMRALRAHVLARRTPPGPRNRHIYVARRRTRRVRNEAALQPFLTKHGFERHFLEDLSIDAQIDLFRHAAWVIGPHGAEFGNLLFCAPGTKVLELSPDVDFKQYFSLMCNKLGLVHGVLPCPTGGDFFADMTVDIEKFRALFRTISIRL